jgi:hypothetical protein
MFKSPTNTRIDIYFQCVAVVVVAAAVAVVVVVVVVVVVAQDCNAK